VPLDLSHPAIRDSYEAMLEVASSELEPDELARWHHMIEACNNLSQAAEVTTRMIGRPMNDSQRRIADEVRQILILEQEYRSRVEGS
jgi:Na+/phosphate symporter